MCVAHSEMVQTPSLDWEEVPFVQMEQRIESSLVLKQHPEWSLCERDSTLLALQLDETETSGQ